MWIVRGTGAPALLATGAWPQISPDGRLVGYSRGFPEELWIAATDGSGERLLYTAPMGQPLLGPWSWSPDGSLIVLQLTSPGAPSSQDPGALWRLDVATGAVRQLLERDGHWPLFSPDGRWISVTSPLGSYVSHGTVGLIDAEGRGQPALFEFVNVQGRAWAADSSGFTVAFQGISDATRTELWWISTAGERRLLGSLDGVAEVSWQPGGARLLYRRWESETVSRLFLAERDGSGEVAISGSEGLSPLSVGLPAWSPDGRWLLASKDDGTFYLIEASTARLYRLDVPIVHGWLDDSRYAASRLTGEALERYWAGEDVPIEWLVCAPRGACVPWTTVPREAVVSYAATCP